MSLQRFSFPTHLAGALPALGRREEAIAEYREALRINPDFEAAKRHLHSILEK